MDEAGYGPNLGPLVVTVTVWEVSGPPREADLWAAFGHVVSQSPPGDASRLHVADSKRVYTPSRGIGHLERSVLCAMNLAGRFPASFRELWQCLTETPETSIVNSMAEPWFAGCDLPLPHTHRNPRDLRDPWDLTARWQACCRENGIRLVTIRSDVVLTERFNRLTREFDSKGIALSRISLELLRRVWDPDDSRPVYIVADKHGGRNRYGELLSEVLDDRLVFRRQEGRELSSYRVGTADIEFRAKAESHLPVALASMVSKYVRELAMTLFNRFWCEQVPGLKPTAGYPVDARRFKQAIAETQIRLGIPDESLWRAR